MTHTFFESILAWNVNRSAVTFTWRSCSHELQLQADVFGRVAVAHALQLAHSPQLHSDPMRPLRGVTL